MLFDATFDRYLSQRPVAVMTRATLEHVFSATALDEVFEQTARTQYTRALAFSTVVGLLEAVVFNRHPSVHAAYQHSPRPISASLASLYDKLNNTEPGVAEAVVRQTAARLMGVVEHLPTDPDPVPGLRVKQLDGNYLAGTEHRLAELRGHGAAALPGMVVVVRDDRTGLLTDLVTSEDGYTQERALIGRVVELVGPNELWVGDRNFAVDELFAGIDGRDAFYVVRYHANTRLHELTPLTAAGVVDTGAVFEQRVRVGRTTCRSVVLRLSEPTTAGEDEIRLLTNVPADRATAGVVAEVYRRRWRIEGSFLELTTSVRCEVNTLGYPRAALLGFALAVCGCNVLRVVSHALEGVQPPPADPTTGPWKASSYAVATELRIAYDGLEVVLPPDTWAVFRGWSGKEMADWLVVVGRRADPKRYRKATRGPKKPVERIIAGRKAPHRSTYRVLEGITKPPKRARRP